MRETHPALSGSWTLLQHFPDRKLWQRDADGASWFYIIRDEQELVYDTFDEAEAMFEAME